MNDISKLELIFIDIMNHCVICHRPYLMCGYELMEGKYVRCIRCICHKMWYLNFELEELDFIDKTYMVRFFNNTRIFLLLIQQYQEWLQQKSIKEDSQFIHDNMWCKLKEFSFQY